MKSNQRYRVSVVEFTVRVVENLPRIIERCMKNDKASHLFPRKLFPQQCEEPLVSLQVINHFHKKGDCLWIPPCAVSCSRTESLGSSCINRIAFALIAGKLARNIRSRQQVSRPELEYLLELGHPFLKRVIMRRAFISSRNDLTCQFSSAT